jgi:hypothetical protein
MIATPGHWGSYVDEFREILDENRRKLPLRSTKFVVNSCRVR